MVQLEKSFLIPKNRWWTRPRDPGSKFIMDNYKAERGRDGRSYRAAEKARALRNLREGLNYW